jgi:hypothetical protein
VLSTPDGGSITQRFTDAASLVRRQQALERTLSLAGWVSEEATALVSRRR